MFGRAFGLLTAILLLAAPARSQHVQFFNSGGVQIHYADSGNGDPIVLIHGFTGSYARHFEAPGVIAALVEAGYRAIAFDCRGHGQSGKPDDAEQ